MTAVDDASQIFEPDQIGEGLTGNNVNSGPIHGLTVEEADGLFNLLSSTFSGYNRGDELLTDTGCATNGFDNFDKIAFWKTPTQQCATQGDQCVPYSRWVSDYIGVMGGQ